MTKDQIEKIKFFAEVAVAVSAIFGLFLYLRANEIAQRANQPKLSLIGVRSIARIAPMFGRDYTQQVGVCRTIVRLSNTGGVSTSLISAKLLLHIRGKTTTYAVSNQPSGEFANSISVFCMG